MRNDLQFRVDPDKVHHHYYRGATVKQIAQMFGKEPSSIHTIIRRERARNPERWPIREEK